MASEDDFVIKDRATDSHSGLNHFGKYGLYTQTQNEHVFTYRLETEGQAGGFHA